RVSKRMRALNIASEREYLRFLTRDPSGNEVIHFLDVISTNVTSFFRQADHFEFLSQVVERWREERQRRFRFWSAACSSGEEPYSMAITLMETLRGYPCDLKVLATDISTTVLAEARAGVYGAEDLKGLSRGLLDRHFARVHDGRTIRYAVKPGVKELIVFKRLNLSQTPYPMRGPFDAIFCRNVMIYFDHELSRRLLAELYRLLKPGGYLFTGHAESLTCMLSEFKIVKPSFYVKMPKSAAKTHGVGAPA
ncbi:MAG: protein-glutamate O-methyltransferase CheR, partial [Kiritimatiellae bacterium]|nr:protein-glutamate O-methyltransferase CheR [Kiritimatiellia bacterium]